ncbi:class II aldolase/adducin family protein [Alkalibaculum sp. M08DMB]|uniref:Class II aldolase/adducin family protein n=1 Tax=Alkalibaculum sporogenes TaxID=2655001 RepID=A0A6A7KB51_9FIRM|nr:class II aldolase/adducin family protein [Alkalibaculum sporogenes]MPW26602.1 class II aldolase/adducin family protein [Alkalibaculum sporogenes]
MLEEKKELLVQIAKEAESTGLCQPGSGNFSIRDVESGYIVVTPSGVGRKFLTPKHILVIDIDGNIIEKNADVKPTSETPMHLTVYKERPDLNGVVHTHSKYATAFAVQNKPIESIVFEAVAYGGRVPVAPYATPCGDLLAQSIIPYIKEHTAILLEKHGVICGGADIQAAFLSANYLEDVAEITFIATVIGGGKLPEPIPQSELDKVGKA